MITSKRQTKVPVNRQRTRLSIKEKFQLIRDCKSMSIQNVVKKYQISQSGVYQILKYQEKIFADYEESGNLDSKNCTPLRNAKLDEMIFEWYQEMRNQGVQVNGPMLQEKARGIAKNSNINALDFKASNGWLDSFKKRHKIVFGSQDNWKGRFMKIITEYEPSNIGTCGETTLFYRLLPSQFSENKKMGKCPNGELSDERLTISMCVFADGTFEKPIVIGKSGNLECFGAIEKDKLPIDWKSNKDVWMTGLIMQEWLNQLNAKLMLENRKILLIMDNTISHPKNALTNIQLFFPNQTQTNNHHLQPLKHGIFDSFKIVYRDHLLAHSILQSDLYGSNCELIPPVNYLDAVLWISDAMKSISSAFVSNCFQKSGFPFRDIKVNDQYWIYENQKLDLEQRIVKIAPNINLNDYIHADDDIFTENETIEIDNSKRENYKSYNHNNHLKMENVECSTVNQKIPHQEALKHLIILKDYFAQNGNLDACNLMLDHIRLVQKKFNSGKIHEIINKIG